jgi:tight adherence protein B
VTDYLTPIAGALAAIAMLCMVGGYAVIQQRRRYEARLQTYLAGSPAFTGTLVAPVEPLTRRRTSNPLIGIAPLTLVQAGMTVTAHRFLTIQLSMSLFGLMVGWLIGRSLGQWLLLALVAGAVIGVALPRLVVKFKRDKRLLKFESQFANALDALANAAEVGLSVSQAMEAVARDMPAPLGTEFTQVLRGLGMGQPLIGALDELADRVPLRDVEIFVAAISIQYRTGGGLSHIMHKLAATVRERVNMRSEIQALTAQPRYSAYLIAALPIIVATIMKFLNPAYFDLLLQPGVMRIALVGAAFGIIVGLFVMLRIADIEV